MRRCCYWPFGLRHFASAFCRCMGVWRELSLVAVGWVGLCADRDDAVEVVLQFEADG